MTFSNLMRENDDRTLSKQRQIGFVVNNDDSSHQDGQKVQRIQVRLAGLHDNLQDEDLPWFTPGGLSAYSGGSDVGDHGPIPPNNAKVYVRFEDDSQYHGQYLGGVAHSDNQVSEFTTPQSGGTDPSSTTDSSADNDDQSTSTAATQLNKSNYDFTQDYPQAHGHVDASGSFNGVSTKTDYHERTHVSGTTEQTDGTGNRSVTINGNATRSDNPNAKSTLPEGFSAAVFGGGTIYISKDCALSVMGNVTVSCNGNASVEAQGNAAVQAKGNATLSAQGTAEVMGQTTKISGTSGVVIAAPTVTIATGTLLSPDPSGAGSGSPSSPQAPTQVQSQTAPTPRKRPQSQPPVNDTGY